MSAFPHRMNLRLTVILVTFCVAMLQAMPMPAQIPAIPNVWEDQPSSPTAARASSGTTSELPEISGLPDYDTLRYQAGLPVEFQTRYLELVPVADDDVLTTAIVFPDVPRDASYAVMTLRRLMDRAMEENFNLQNSRRSVLIARSQTVAARAPFIPFLDLVGESNVAETKNANATYVNPETGMVEDTTRRERVYTNRGGVETGVNLPTGGSLRGNTGMTRTDTRTTDDSGVLVDETGYSSAADIQFLQPLLRGAGPDVARAGLRRARIRELDSVLADRIRQRDVAFSVISTYFSILQAARRLKVSQDALQIRAQFLEETRVRFNVGRVDESEILRAEINYLNELQRAVERRRQLDEAREDMLILLGLPLDTPISFLDITDELASRGRVEIPAADYALTESLDQRPELMRADLSVSLAEIDRTVARNDLLPDLNLNASYNRNDAANDIYEATGMENERWQAGAGIRVPLVNIQRRESARQASISLESVRTDRLARERDLTAEVLTARRNVLSTEAQLTILSKSVEQARKSLDLINGRFEVGFATVTEVRLAQDDLFDAETNYSNALLNYQIDVARLYVALGRPLL